MVNADINYTFLDRRNQLFKQNFSTKLIYTFIYFILAFIIKKMHHPWGWVLLFCLFPGRYWITGSYARFHSDDCHQTQLVVTHETDVLLLHMLAKYIVNSVIQCTEIIN